MAIQGSGPISLTDLSDEFGGTIPHSLSEYYRDGGLVPSNNTNVPTSGPIGLQFFYNAVNEITVVAAAGASLDVSTLFDAAIWTGTVPKRVTINSGAVLGPVTIPSNMGGNLSIDNAGEIYGTGGATSGAAGGDAITNNATGTVTINNTGTIGGGGGAGGQGGDGTATSTEPPTQGNNHQIYAGNYYNLRFRLRYGNTNSWGYVYSYMNNTNGVGTNGSAGLVAAGFFFKASIGSAGDTVLGGLTFSGFSSSAFNYASGINKVPTAAANFNGNQFRATNNNPVWPNGNGYCYISGVATQDFTFKLGFRGYAGSGNGTNFYYSGGYLDQGGTGPATTGGAGGDGQGYLQTNATGAAGGSNAGTGGAGGLYGAAGATGTNGSTTNGLAGGAAGAAVAGNTVTMNNTGTLHGTVV